MMMGLIAESCQNGIRKNMDSGIQNATSGLNDTNTRVRYASLFAMSNMFEILAPQVQYKYHAEVIPTVVEIMMKEKDLKMQS
jgi:hypothetical protein